MKTTRKLLHRLLAKITRKPPKTQQPQQESTTIVPHEFTMTDPHESTPTDPHQLQSHFFSKLPPEIRSLIYHHMVNNFGKTIHILVITNYTQSRLTSHLCTAGLDEYIGPDGDENPWGIPYCPCHHLAQSLGDTNSAAIPRQSFMSLLLTCKRLYVYYHL